VIARRLNFTCRRFGTLFSTYIGGVSRYTPAYNNFEDGTETPTQNSDGEESLYSKNATFRTGQQLEVKDIF
jgi:hypothetical protein